MWVTLRKPIALQKKYAYMYRVCLQGREQGGSRRLLLSMMRPSVLFIYFFPHRYVLPGESLWMNHFNIQVLYLCNAENNVFSPIFPET